MDRGGSVARCRLIAVLTVRILRRANPSGLRIEGHWWREELWGLTPESVSTMRASGPRNPGDSGCVRSQTPLVQGAQKTGGRRKRFGTPLLYPAEQVDYSIFRSPAIFVAEVTGGAIVICGPCTVGS
jgi:hypothetical protein